MIFAGVAFIKLKNVDLNFFKLIYFNLLPSLPLVATDDRKSFQCLTKLDHYFLNSVNAKKF